MRNIYLLRRDVNSVLVEETLELLERHPTGDAPCAIVLAELLPRLHREEITEGFTREL
jgi:hypothetical protein